MPRFRPYGSEHPSGVAHDLRVSLIGSLPPVKGVSAYTSNLLDALAGRGDVKIDFTGFRSIYPRWAYPGGGPDEPDLTVGSIPAGARVRNDLTWYNPLSWLRAGFALRGDVVHAQWWSYALAPVYITILAIARLRGKRVLITVHNVAPHEEGLAKRVLNRAVLGLGHRFIVHSEQNRASLLRLVQGGAPIDVAPHGILPTPRTGMSRASARERLGLDGGARVALCFGNIRPYKGVDVLLRAFADVTRSEPGATLVVAGKPWGGWSPYDRLIDDLGIRPNVRLFLDYVPTREIEAYFVASDVVVLPYTRFDGQTGVGTRALPFGRPLIVTDTGGLRELVFDPEAVVPPNDAPALGRAITRVLADEALRDRMSVDSLTIAGSLGWDRIAERTRAIYASLAGMATAAEDQVAAQAAEAGR